GPCTIGLQAQVADDSFVSVGPGPRQRHEPLAVIVVGRAERVGLGLAEAWADGKEARPAALGRKAGVETLELGLVRLADRTNANGARSARVRIQRSPGQVSRSHRI